MSSWLIIILVLLVAFGPVFWLLPSKRDRRLSALRQKALSLGLVVELRRLPKLDAEPAERVSAGGKTREPVIECAAYLWNMGKKLRFLPQVRLLRGTEGVLAVSGWVMDPARKPSRDNLEVLLETLTGYIETLPVDVVGFEVSERQLTWYWLERPGSDVALVTEMAARIQRLEDELCRVETRLEEEIFDPDS